MMNPQELQGFGEEIANYTFKDVSHEATPTAVCQAILYEEKILILQYNKNLVLSNATKFTCNWRENQENTIISKSSNL